MNKPLQLRRLCGTCRTYSMRRLSAAGADKRWHVLARLVGAMCVGLTAQAVVHAADAAAVPVLTVPRPLTAPPAGVSDLRFSEMFKLPVGPKGLEPTDKLRALDGHRVRLLGYVAQEEAPVRGRLILSPLPAALSGPGEGQADDLPGQAVFVRLSKRYSDQLLPQPAAHAGGLIQLIGTLHLKPTQDDAPDPDGRSANLRLDLDDAFSAALCLPAPARP